VGGDGEDECCRAEGAQGADERDGVARAPAQERGEAGDDADQGGFAAGDDGEAALGALLRVLGLARLSACFDVGELYGQCGELIVDLFDAMLIVPVV